MMSPSNSLNKFNILRDEIFKFIANYGQEGFMPQRKQLRIYQRTEIEKSIAIFGGFRKVASLLNLSIARKQANAKKETCYSQQKDVYIEISQLVQSAIDGFKVCIFAYGQTDSSKTHTMMGKPDGQKGLIPRSLEQIFETIQALKYQGWKYKLQVSMLEIYNETIRDLLCSSADATHINELYTIRHDLDGNTYVSDLIVMDVFSLDKVFFLLNHATLSRSVGKTQMNEHSSRSHFVFTLRISGVKDDTEQQIQGVLNLIDLAGSECLAKSCSTGERLKETQAIDKSLSYLSDVVFAIAKKQEHVPYKNSKLTFLLQPCLEGDSKTLMFVNISPESSSANESLCSLGFAARVKACEIGAPH